MPYVYHISLMYHYVAIKVVLLLYLQSVLTSQVKAMRKYGLWVVLFQKDIPTEVPKGHPISWKEVHTTIYPGMLEVGGVHPPQILAE